jgi:uncharacterized protein
MSGTSIPEDPRSELPTEEQGGVLLGVALRALRVHFGLEDQGFETEGLALPRAAGVFATLECGEELRGCIGFLRDDVDLATLAQRAVVAAAVDDPRFRSIGKEEVSRVRISITVLAPPTPLHESSEIRIGRDGLIVERGAARGLLLPQVAARHGWDGERFCSETCRKAGLPPDAWRFSGTKVLRFEAVHFDSDRSGS